MGLIGSYKNPGPGINPHAPKKKPFFRFWELLWRNLGKLFSLNLTYATLHIPLFLAITIFIETNNKFTTAMTIFLLLVQFLIEGPTMAGCARVLRLIVLDKPFFFGEEFKKGFTTNFGAALLYWMLDALVIASIVCGYYAYPALAQNAGKGVYILYGISLSVGLVLLFMNFYIMPLQVATTLSKRSVIKNSLMLAVISLKQCLISLGGIVLMVGITVLLVMINTLFLFIIAFFPAAFIGYLVLFVNYPVIQKLVINPYYESTGEQNPEAEPDYSDDDERLFTDRGGTEAPAKAETKKGKVIS